MAWIRKESDSGPGRGTLGPRRPAVSAEGFEVDFWDDEDDAGPAGVREPRRPRPSGPLSDAGAMPIPEPPVYLVLADPRH